MHLRAAETQAITPMRFRSFFPVTSSAPGKAINTALPMTYRASTVPSRESRLSLERLRLSPMTKMLPSGTVRGNSVPSSR